VLSAAGVFVAGEGSIDAAGAWDVDGCVCPARLVVKLIRSMRPVHARNEGMCENHQPNIRMPEIDGGLLFLLATPAAVKRGARTTSSAPPCRSRANVNDLTLNISLGIVIGGNGAWQ
jgi:hypothetical protein